MGSTVYWRMKWYVSIYVVDCHTQTSSQGLGKTLQTISFLSYLKHHREISGPHLVVVPKSTLQNWAREFAQWSPDFNIVTLAGSKDERAEIIASRLIPQDFEVCITTYEMCLIEKSALKKFSFEYIVIDEAHRIKNVDSILSQIVRAFISRGRLLITGTPLQNNLKELFSLLNFICPEIFVNYKDLDSFLHKDSDNTAVEEEKSKKVVEALHKILRPFLLRRVKADVEKSLLPSMFLVLLHSSMANLRCAFQRRKLTYMWACRKCKENGIGRYWRRTSTQLMVGRFICHLFFPLTSSRIDWQEGRKDEAHEHGHAGRVISWKSYPHAHNWCIASQSRMSSLPFRWRSTSISSSNSCLLSQLLGTRSSLYH